MPKICLCVFLFSGHALWGRKTHKNKISPKIPGQSRENFVYVFFFFMCVFFPPRIILRARASPKIPGQSRENFVYVFFLYVFSLPGSFFELEPPPESLGIDRRSGKGVTVFFECSLCSEECRKTPTTTTTLRKKRKFSAQRGSFWPDIPADIRPKTSVRPSTIRHEKITYPKKIYSNYFPTTVSRFRFL